MANGIVSYTSTIVRGLRELGVCCHVLTPRLMDAQPDEFVHVLHPDLDSLKSKIRRKLDPQGWPQQAGAIAMKQELRWLHETHGVQLLELEESYGWARFVAGASPVPLVVRLHGPWFLNGAANGAPRDSEFKTKDRWERRGVLLASALSAPSRDVLERSRDHWQLGASTNRLEQVIPNPVEPVAPGDRWKLDECDRQRIAFIGRFDRHKGGDVMIDAFARITQVCPEARLDIVGPDRGCIDEGGKSWSLHEYLQAKLSDAGRQKVRYHGFQPPAEAAKLRKKALVTVAPSRYETFGIAAAEAMAAGCPLVACAAGGLTELVQHDRNGLLARPGDWADLADKVLELIHDPARAQQLGTQAAVDVAQRYAPALLAAQTLEYYKKVLGQRASIALSSAPASV